MTAARLIDLTEDDLRRIVREEVARQGSDGYLTVPEAAKYARKHPQTIRGWIKEGLPARGGKGKHKLLRREDLDAWIKRSGANEDNQLAKAIAITRRGG
jgi:excisionase family DNA binding protein